MHHDLNKPIPTKEHLADYFSQDKLLCLVCGKRLHVLAKHLVFCHDMTADDYRKEFNIPWSYGLASPTARENYSNALKDRISKGDDTLHTAIPGEVRHTGPRLFVREKAKDLTKKRNPCGQIYRYNPVDNMPLQCLCGEKFERTSALSRSTQCPDCAKKTRLMKKRLRRTTKKEKQL